jgi:hypothetical protein
VARTAVPGGVAITGSVARADDGVGGTKARASTATNAPSRAGRSRHGVVAAARTSTSETPPAGALDADAGVDDGVDVDGNEDVNDADGVGTGDGGVVAAAGVDAPVATSAARVVDAGVGRRGNEERETTLMLWFSAAKWSCAQM